MEGELPPNLAQRSTQTLARVFACGGAFAWFVESLDLHFRKFVLLSCKKNVRYQHGNQRLTLKMRFFSKMGIFNPKIGTFRLEIPFLYFKPPKRPEDFSQVSFEWGQEQKPPLTHFSHYSTKLVCQKPRPVPRLTHHCFWSVGAWLIPKNRGFTPEKRLD